MSHPYSDLPETAFWKTGVAGRAAHEIEGLWTPKLSCSPRTRFATFGSCFSQHFGREVTKRGLDWIDAEPAPGIVPQDVAREYNYGVFSARTGNIYTAANLAQWLGWAAGAATPPDLVWEQDGRAYDPFRPAVEPGGFADRAEVLESRAVTLRALRAAVETADVFIFTMGLTEGWEDAETGVNYPACPGTIAGTYDSGRHRFVNYTSARIRADMERALEHLRAMNPKLRVILTVSPVPLTATAAGRHALVSNSYTKSTLRSVAGELADADPGVDYFPSYELVTTPIFGGELYAENRRQLSPEGVSFVMDVFFGALGLERRAPLPEWQRRAAAARAAYLAQQGAGGPNPAPAARKDDDAITDDGADDLVCEEEMLSAFAPDRASRDGRE